MALIPKVLRPSAVWQDLRAFFGERHPHQWLFAGLSLAVTSAILLGFVLETPGERPYRDPEVLYFTLWPANRTLADIKADQARARPVEEAQRKAQAEAQAERRRQFERLQQKMKAVGF